MYAPSCGGDDDDGGGVTVDRRLDGGDGSGVSGVRRVRRQLAQLLKQLLVVHGRFSFFGNLTIMIDRIIHYSAFSASRAM